MWRPKLNRLWRDTHRLDNIRQRLLEFLNPSSLEHLVVSLLQLEHPEEIWRQTGGPGEGRLDGIGNTESGETVGLLQVKFRAHDPVSRFGDRVDDTGVRRYVAILLPWVNRHEETTP